MAGAGKTLKIQLMIHKSSGGHEVNGTSPPADNNDVNQSKDEIFYKVGHIVK